MKYRSQITGIGEMALDFLQDNMLIVFNDNAPAELAEISVLHTIEKIEKDIVVGDKISICKNEYVVTAIGKEANKTFKQLGHCTFKFTAMEEVALPGHIELKGKGVPNIKIGGVIEII